MFETGLAIFLGLVFIFIKLKRRTMLRALNHDMAIDVCVTLLTLAKKAFGYIQGDLYFPGYIRLAV